VNTGAAKGYDGVSLILLSAGEIPRNWPQGHPLGVPRTGSGARENGVWDQLVARWNETAFGQLRTDHARCRKPGRMSIRLGRIWMPLPRRFRTKHVPFCVLPQKYTFWCGSSCAAQACGLRVVDSSRARTEGTSKGTITQRRMPIYLIAGRPCSRQHPPRLCPMDDFAVAGDNFGRKVGMADMDER